MAKQVVKNYSFDTTAKTVTLTDFGTVLLERLALITDTTTNQILYNFADSLIATASVAGNVVSLSTLPGGVANSNKLRIDYDDITGDPTYDVPSLASNAAQETDGNLAAIKADVDKIPSKGAATTTNSTPVNIASDQTVPVSGTVTTTPSGTQTVSGTVTANAGTNLNTSALALDATLTGGTQKTKLVDSGGTNVGSIAATGALKVDGSAVTQPVSGTVTITPSGTQIVSGTVTANIGTTNGLALDSSVNGILLAQGSTTSGQKGSLIQGAVTTAAPTYTSAQTSPISLTTAGALRTDASATTQPVSGTVTANIAANSSVNVNQVAGSTVDTNSGNKSAGTQRMVIATDQPNLTTALNVIAAQSGTWTVQPGNTANTTPWLVIDSTDQATGSSVPTRASYQGSQAKTALPAAAGTDGSIVGVMADKFGRQITILNGMRDIINPITQLTLTSMTTETTLIASVASVFNDLLSLVVINTSASATQVDFRDSTTGTIRLSLYIPAGDTRGVVFNTPMPQAAVNTAWTAKCGTSVASIIITGSYISNK